MIAGISLPPELGLTDLELGEALGDVLNVQARANARYFERHPEAPCCLNCGAIKYRLPAMTQRQIFASAHDVCKRHRAGCAEAAAYEAGMAQSKGVDARVAVELLSPGEYHAVVIYPDGRRSDPSANLPR